MRKLTYKKEKVIKDDGRYIIFYEFDRRPDRAAGSERSDRSDVSDESEGSDRSDESERADNT
jgi:hypothetical protein